MNTRWTNYFLTLAETAAKQSKDPNTKVGAVIADKHDRVISSGFNGFPRGIADNSKLLENRDTKLMITMHAETNAILFSQQNLEGMSIYVTHTPCSNCAALIIQAGIKKVVVGTEPGTELTDRWKESLNMSKKLFKEAGVKYKEIPR